MNVQGSCHCGEITYEAEVDPDKVNLCNCTDCQMLTGSAFRVSVPAPAATFRLLTGRGRRCTSRRPTAARGEGIRSALTAARRSARPRTKKIHRAIPYEWVASGNGRSCRPSDAFGAGPRWTGRRT